MEWCSQADDERCRVSDAVASYHAIALNVYSLFESTSFGSETVSPLAATRTFTFACAGGWRRVQGRGVSGERGY